MSRSGSSEALETVRRCPKRVLNGPCGGMRSDGTCEVSGLKCIFHLEFPSEFAIDEGFKIRPRINPRRYFTRLLTDTFDRATWIAEIPPRVDVMDRLEILRGLPADALGIPDNPLGRTHIDAVSFACILRKVSERELVVHLTCRDLNRIALKSRIIGLGLMGVEHVLALTGDYISSEERIGASGVFDLDSMRLIYMIRLLSDYGVDDKGSRITGRVRLHVGAGLNTYISPSIELSRALRKLTAGAEFFISQIIFDEGSVKTLLDELRRNGVQAPVFASFLLQDRERILRFARALGIPVGEIPNSLEKLAERYLEILRALRRGYGAVGAYISALGKLEYFRIWSDLFMGSC